MPKYFHIAVDGPVAAGKGTVCRLVAQRLGFLYVDTGAMYRVAALLTKRNKLNFSQEAEITSLINNSEIDLRVPTKTEKDGRLITVLLNGEDVSWAIRTEEMSRGSSLVSKLPKVREILVKKQQEIAEGKNIVMEGRDITYKVLPKADLKIFLTGSDLIRAKRRHQQLLTKGVDSDFNEVMSELKQRDEQDSNRKTDPLKIVPGAWVLDTSDMGIEKVVQVIVDRVNLLRNHD